MCDSLKSLPTPTDNMRSKARARKLAKSRSLFSSPISPHFFLDPLFRLPKMSFQKTAPDGPLYTHGLCEEAIRNVFSPPDDVGAAGTIRMMCTMGLQKGSGART